MNVLLVVVAILGTISTTMSIGLFVYFVRSRHMIGRAVGYDKFAEAVFASVTAFFAFTSQGLWNLPLSDTLVSTLRIVAFFFSIAASLHLTSSVLQIIAREERDGDDN